MTVCPAAVAVATPPAPVPPAPTTASDDDTHSHSDTDAVATPNHRHKQHPFDPVLHLALLRFLTNDAPHKCPFPGCTYKFGANIEEVNSNAVPIREHVKFHHFSMRKDGNENGYKCGWPGCASTSRFDAGTITRHTEEKHLGWRYRCPDGKAHGPLGFVRADTLTKHIKEQAASGSHMNSEYSSLRNPNMTHVFIFSLSSHRGGNNRPAQRTAQECSHEPAPCARRCGRRGCDVRRRRGKL